MEPPTKIRKLLPSTHEVFEDLNKLIENLLNQETTRVVKDDTLLEKIITDLYSMAGESQHQLASAVISEDNLRLIYSKIFVTNEFYSLPGKILSFLLQILPLSLCNEIKSDDDDSSPSKIYKKILDEVYTITPNLSDVSVLVGWLKGLKNYLTIQALIHHDGVSEKVLVLPKNFEDIKLDSIFVKRRYFEAVEFLEDKIELGGAIRKSFKEYQSRRLLFQRAPNEQKESSKNPSDSDFGKLEQEIESANQTLDYLNLKKLLADIENQKSLNKETKPKFLKIFIENFLLDRKPKITDPSDEVKDSFLEILCKFFTSEEFWSSQQVKNCNHDSRENVSQIIHGLIDSTNFFNKKSAFKAMMLFAPNRDQVAKLFQDQGWHLNIKL